MLQTFGPATYCSPIDVPLLPAMDPVLLQLGRRLVRKTRVNTQEPLDSVELGDEVGSSAHRQVYLVTLPHPKQAATNDGVQLSAPGSFSKAQILERFLSCLRDPIYVDGRHRAAGGPGVEVSMTGVWREFHKQGEQGGPPRVHDHMPVLAAKQFRYLPVKRALLQRYGLASHWSCTHVGYWSAVRYLVAPSPSKPLASLDSAPVTWSSNGEHPPLNQCMHEPLTASALRKRRLYAETAAAESGQKAPKVSDMDIWPIVVQQGFRNAPDAPHAHLELIAFAKNSCSREVHNFLFKHRQRLSSLIDDIWRWENVEASLDHARLTRLAALEVSAEHPCVCGGRWLDVVRQIFERNNICIEDVCRDVHHALHAGRSELAPVVVFAGRHGGEGKSFFLKPLYTCYGHDFVFSSPQKGNFPLVDLPGKKVVFLDDWRFNEDVVSFATQCLWYDGSPFPIAQPQNQPGRMGHILYRGSAPLFVTTKACDMQRLEAWAALNPRTGSPWDANASMVFRRLKVYQFTQPLPKPDAAIPFCARCFATLILPQRQ